MIKLGKRPEDFYGPEDWYPGMDMDREMRELDQRQRAWDIARAKLPLWRRLIGAY